jgi:hypothetical protein
MNPSDFFKSNRHYSPFGQSPCLKLDYVNLISQACTNNNYEIKSKSYDAQENIIVRLKISNEEGTKNFQCKFLVDKLASEYYSSCEIIPLSANGEQIGPEQTVSLERDSSLKKIINTSEDDGGLNVKLPSGDPKPSPPRLLHLPA